MSKPSKRTALHVLTVKRLAGLCDAFGLDRVGLTRKDDLIDTLGRSKRASFAAILEVLSRAELKTICAAHELDDAGREKATIAARILGETPSPAVSVDTPSATPRPAKPKASNEANNDEHRGSLGFEDKLWAAADLLRNNMDPAEYKHVVLGLIFLKYISDAFEERQNQLIDTVSNPESGDYIANLQHREAELAELLEDRDEYTAENVFWVPHQARWPHLQAQATQPTIGKLVDDAMDAIEQDNRTLKGALPKVYGRAGVDKRGLGELINLIAGIGLGTKQHRAKDTLGRVYKNFRRGVENPFDGAALARIPSEWLGFPGSRVVPSGSGGTTA